MSDDDDSSTPNHTDGEGGGSRDRPMEPSKDSTRKIIRVLTVLAYLSSVSMAAIMLSLYYIFLWNPTVPTHSAQIQDPAYYVSNSSAALYSHLSLELPPTLNNSDSVLEEPRVLPRLSSDTQQARSKEDKEQQWQDQEPATEKRRKKRFASKLFKLLSSS